MRALVAAVLLALAPAILAAGCGGVPDQVEGTVRYRQHVAGVGRGVTITLTTFVPTNTAALARAGATGITPREMSALVGELKEVGLFELDGRTDAPRELPPGAIGVDTSARKFFVTLADLRNMDEATRFRRSAERIVLATQGGPHYSLPK